MKKYFLCRIVLIMFVFALASCGGRLVVPEGLPKATIQIVLPKNTTAGDIGLGLAGKLECNRLFGIVKGTRPTIFVTGITKFSNSKPTDIPAGEDRTFVITQELGLSDRVGIIYWTIFVRPNATYEVVVKNNYADKPLFGSYISYYNIEVLENKFPIATVTETQPDQACEELQ